MACGQRKGDRCDLTVESKVGSGHRICTHSEYLLGLLVFSFATFSSISHPSIHPSIHPPTHPIRRTQQTSFPSLSCPCHHVIYTPLSPPNGSLFSGCTACLFSRVRRHLLGLEMKMVKRKGNGPSLDMGLAN